MGGGEKKKKKKKGNILLAHDRKANSGSGPGLIEEAGGKKARETPPVLFCQCWGKKKHGKIKPCAETA